MNMLVEKCRDVEKELSSEWGEFVLFGLFEREDTPGKWDVIVSAPWLSADRKSIDTVVSKFRPRLTDDEWLKIARIVSLNPKDEFVRTMNMSYRVEHGSLEVASVIFNGIRILRAFIITSEALSLPRMAAQSATA